jgi:hypothetical protein
VIEILDSEDDYDPPVTTTVPPSGQPPRLLNPPVQRQDSDSSVEAHAPPEVTTRRTATSDIPQEHPTPAAPLRSPLKDKQHAQVSVQLEQQQHHSGCVLKPKLENRHDAVHDLPPTNEDQNQQPTSSTNIPAPTRNTSQNSQGTSFTSAPQDACHSLDLKCAASSLDKNDSNQFIHVAIKLEDIPHPEIIVLDDDDSTSACHSEPGTTGNPTAPTQQQPQHRPGTSADDAISISSGEDDDDASNDGLVSGYIRRPEQASFASKFEQMSGQASPLKRPTPSPARIRRPPGSDRLPPLRHPPAAAPSPPTPGKARRQLNLVSADQSSSLAPQHRRGNMDPSSIPLGRNIETSSRLGLAMEQKGEVGSKQSQRHYNRNIESFTGEKNCRVRPTQGSSPHHIAGHRSTLFKTNPCTRTMADRQQPRSGRGNNKNAESSDESFVSLQTQISPPPTETSTRPIEERHDTSVVTDKISSRATECKSIRAAVAVDRDNDTSHSSYKSETSESDSLFSCSVHSDDQETDDEENLKSLRLLYTTSKPVRRSILSDLAPRNKLHPMVPPDAIEVRRESKNASLDSGLNHGRPATDGNRDGKVPVASATYSASETKLAPFGSVNHVVRQGSLLENVSRSECISNSVDEAQRPHGKILSHHAAMESQRLARARKQRLVRVDSPDSLEKRLASYDPMVRHESVTKRRRRLEIGPQTHVTPEPEDEETNDEKYVMNSVPHLSRTTYDPSGIPSHKFTVYTTNDGKYFLRLLSSEQLKV